MKLYFANNNYFNHLMNNNKFSRSKFNRKFGNHGGTMNDKYLNQTCLLVYSRLQGESASGHFPLKKVSATLSPAKSVRRHFPLKKVSADTFP